MRDRKVNLLNFKENKEAYRSFVLMFKDEIDDDGVRNADCLVRWAEGEGEPDFEYGNSGHIEECVETVLRALGKDCEFVPAGFESEGISFPGQANDVILIKS